MKLIALVRFSKNESWKERVDNYKTKKAYLEDLKLNGYMVRYNRIYTEEQWEELEV